MILEAIRQEFSKHPRQVLIREALVVREPSLSGARIRALEVLRAAVITRAGTWAPTGQLPADEVFEG